MDPAKENGKLVIAIVYSPIDSALQSAPAGPCGLATLGGVVSAEVVFAEVVSAEVVSGKVVSFH